MTHQPAYLGTAILTIFNKSSITTTTAYAYW
jgi:hypothetical protein